MLYIQEEFLPLEPVFDKAAFLDAWYFSAVVADLKCS